jgi:hypothetical protein
VSWPPGETTQALGVNSYAHFEVGDQVRVPTGMYGTFVGDITGFSTDEYGGQYMHIRINNTAPEDIESVLGTPITLVSDDTYYDDTVEIYPTTNNTDVQIKFPTDTYIVGEVYDVVVQWNYHRKSGSGNDPVGEDAKMYYVGELVNPTHDANELLPMTPFEACDPIPGDPATPEKTIHRIIENIDMVSAGSSGVISLTADKTAGDYPWLIGVHRYGFIAYMSETDVALK